MRAGGEGKGKEITDGGKGEQERGRGVPLADPTTLT